MIVDQVIDANNAKYFCMFKDPEFKKKVDEAASKKNQEAGKELMAKSMQPAGGKKLLIS